MQDIYEHIAPFYDVDMGRNMPMDDVAFWLQCVRDIDGPVLELGCGTGRITRRLAKAGIDMVGVDRTAAMLGELRTASSLAAQIAVLRADIRALPFKRCFDAVICPYSLVTSLLTDDDLSLALRESHRVLNDNGLLVIDAFMPRTDMYSDAFTLAYRRPWGEKFLERWQRVSPAGDGLNRIERQYRVLDQQLDELRSISTSERVRPFAPQVL